LSENPEIAPAATASDGTYRFAHKAMAAVFEIICAHEDRAYAEQAAVAGFDLIDRLETELTCHRPGSDISRINEAGSGEAVRVGAWTMECLQLARQFHHETGGAFDISIGSGLGRIELNPGESIVKVLGAGVRLDLGGIGKGFALDLVGALLNEWDVRQILLHGGYSSVLALDPPPGQEGWPLTISLPSAGSPLVLARFSARRQSWSASGIRKGDHILDPRTGLPVRNRPAVWVSGSIDALAAACPPLIEAGPFPCAAAEALSTAFMIMALEQISACCSRHPGIEARVLSGESNPAATPVMIHLATAARLP
jgi:FAD:protein FMN transferase